MGALCVLIFEYLPSFVGATYIFSLACDSQTGIYLYLIGYIVYLFGVKPCLITSLEEKLDLVNQGKVYTQDIGRQSDTVAIFAIIELIFVMVGYWIILNSIL